jgi:hypothetical protein
VTSVVTARRGPVRIQAWLRCAGLRWLAGTPGLGGVDEGGHPLPLVVLASGRPDLVADGVQAGLLDEVADRLVEDRDDCRGRGGLPGVVRGGLGRAVWRMVAGGQPAGEVAGAPAVVEQGVDAGDGPLPLGGLPDLGEPGAVVAN